MKKTDENFQNVVGTDKFSNPQNESMQQSVLTSIDKSEKTVEQLTSVALIAVNRPKTLSYRAFCYALLSGFAYSAIFVITKQAENIDVSQTYIYFAAGILFLSLPIAAYGNISFRMSKTTFGLLTVRGIFSVLSGYLGFLAFRYLPLGEASVIVFSTPVLVTVLARILFKEECSRIDIVNLVLTLFGLAFVAKVPQAILQPENRLSHEYMVGMLAAFGSLISFTIIILLTRKTKAVHYCVVSITTGVYSLLTCFIINAYSGNLRNPCGREYVPIVLALLSFTGSMSFIRSIQLYNAGPLTTLRSGADISFAFIWQITYFGDIPDGFVMSGAVLVMISIIFIGIKIWILSLSEESLIRKRLAFFVK